MSLPRPLDPIRSIKMKIGLLVAGAGAAALAYFRIRLGWLPTQTSLIAIGVGIVTSQILAHGMTRPLRQMTAAARVMARGDYSQRVRATSRDEVGELAQAFNTMAADLEAADQQRRELIANVSHELRTPISALRAVLENVVDGVAEPDPATMRTALSQTERLGRLVSELLDLSRVDAGVTPLHREYFELSPMLDEVVAEAEVSGRDARFVLDVRPGKVFADRARLHQVIWNLLDNAMRHGPQGGEIVIVSRPVGDGGVVIEVRDQGPGIAPADRERVFERFTRGERAGGGTGLGLAIARWVIDLHGGEISVVDPAGIRLVLPGSPG
ncbi:sensor histidine kinase [Kibdelosporangium aridum]|uniref:Signal transduction histidine-protein kinase/phosphatase MprB n=1 Tax=Kibdelosporangium aridum TaxID=2030 RepID=A0A1W2FYI0_KIBAR|nr:HAMP domain-containing sensor histidine kinase [Kibdelosporangium aridum]SMD27017.1 Signal transduction histidine kinase [Kibdelosporangium aridum]